MANSGVSVTVDSTNFLAQIQSLDRKAKKVVEEYIKTEALNFQSAVRKQLTTNNSVVTGNLRRSITVEKKHSYEYEVGTNVNYAPYVEFGTRRMRAKPYFQPVIDRTSQEFKEKLASLIRRALM